MKLSTVLITALSVILPGNIVLAGGFYQLAPSWLDTIYHFVLLSLIVVGLIVCLMIFRNLKGGNLDKPWLFFVIALALMLIRSILATLTIFDAGYFQAIVFAGLDVGFYVMFLIGLVLYKIGLN